MSIKFINRTPKTTDFKKKEIVIDGKKGNYTTLRFHKNDINKVTCVYGYLTPKLKWCGVELEEITY